jgi:tetratricopeptide (TPR) repeat protein
VLVDDAVSAESAVAALDSLAAKSLVSPDRLSQDKGAYRLFEMTRAYAGEKLAARGRDERAATARRHAGYYLRNLEGFDPLNAPVDRTRHLRALSNIRAALVWSFGPDGEPWVAIRLAARSSAVFLDLSLLAKCRAWCERVLSILGVHERTTLDELELQAALGLALMFTRGNHDAAETALRRALDIAVTVADRRNELRLLGRLQMFHERIGDYATAHTWSRRAADVGDAIGDPEAIAVAASIAGISHHLTGDQQRARQAFELCLRQALPSEPARTIHYGFDHRNRAAIGLARTLWLLGHPDRATALADETIAAAAGLDHPLTHCIALVWDFSIRLATGDLERAADTLDTFARVAEVNALGPYITATPGLRGKLALRFGRPDEAIAAIEESLARLRAVRYELLTLSLSSALIGGFSAAGRHRDALALASDIIDRCTASGELFSMPDLIRTKAACLRACGGPAVEVEALLCDSLGLARRQGARAWELCAATDLARLWGEDGRVEEATALLRPIREGFSEGFWTKDLRAATALLRDLGGQASRVPTEPHRR